MTNSDPGSRLFRRASSPSGRGEQPCARATGAAARSRADARSLRTRRPLLGPEHIAPLDRESLVNTESGIAAFFNDPIVHWYRNMFSHVPSINVREVAAMLKAIHAGEDIAAARQRVVRVIEMMHGLALSLSPP